MSWQAYVDDQLIGTGQIAKAAILGGSDGSTWAIKPADFLKPGEGPALVALFKSPADVFSKGITIGGVKYMGIKGDPRSIYGKKGATGIVCVKTNQSIVVGYYNEMQQPGNAANVVEKLGDYLIDNSY
ncbi:profilin I [Heterostelium album PN500]|uniref:Profilin n=1 Tax=Heterostelium pallidum (strain ATCC 26659 / Pp 5 / PN500) TaxID=670386 RepID=D3B3P0_HETP5|nr:profilin I [Heterostelium album PN500]EFA83938.1 profilin I [Heterostelium album PN500]|eukprot:XP_020436055.1 profilin I [Heterostelium album PN500]